MINAHKWLGAPFDCSLYYVRDPEHLMRVMSTNPSYLQSSVDGQVKNLRDWGIPLGRRFRALKLWFVIREQGVSGLAGAPATRHRQRALARREGRRDAGLAGRRAGAVQTVCVRHEPPRAARGRGARRAHDRLGRGGEPLGRGLSTPAVLDGRWMVRVSIGALATEAADVAAVWAAMREAAEASAEHQI